MKPGSFYRVEGHALLYEEHVVMDENGQRASLSEFSDQQNVCLLWFLSLSEL